MELLLWAFTARIDQTVTVRGRLEPSGSVRDVESPSAGVVSKVFVKDGQQVQQGQPLFDVEAKGLASRRQALETTLSLFELQSQTLKDILRSGGDPGRFQPLPSFHRLMIQSWISSCELLVNKVSNFGLCLSSCRRV